MFFNESFFHFLNIFETVYIRFYFFFIIMNGNNSDFLIIFTINKNKSLFMWNSCISRKCPTIKIDLFFSRRMTCCFLESK